MQFEPKMGWKSVVLGVMVLFLRDLCVIII